MFKIPLAKVDSITDHPTQPQNSVVKAAGLSIVTMKNHDGSYRFAENELVVIVPENAIVPERQLRETGFWNEEKGKGYLAGSKGNRVKGRVVDGVPSEALIWRIEDLGGHVQAATGDYPRCVVLPYPRSEYQIGIFQLEHDLADFFGITEYVPES